MPPLGSVVQPSPHTGVSESITVLIRAADSENIHAGELTGVGYALEHMVEDIAEHVDELFRLGGAK